MGGCYRMNWPELIGSLALVGYGFWCGWQWRSSSSVSVETFDEAMRQSWRSVEMIRYGLRREARLSARLKASNRLLEQATKKRDPGTYDFSIFGV